MESMAGRGNGSCRAETRCENAKNGAKKAHEGIKSCDSGEEGRRVFVTRAGNISCVADAAR